MATVLYNSKAIIPAPLVNISKQYIKTGDGENIGTTYSITLTGTIVPYKGSPRGGTAAVAGFDGAWWTLGGYPPDETVGETERLKYIILKQGHLRRLFGTDGQLLEIQPLDGSNPLLCNPRVIEIVFSENIWFDRSDYTITLEADSISYSGITSEDNFQVDGQNVYLSDAAENWTIELDETPINSSNGKSYRVSHTISATGRRYYNEAGELVQQPWYWAKTWCASKLGFDGTAISEFTSGIFDSTVASLHFNHIVTESVDEKAGSVSLTETWVLADQTATEDFSISTTSSLEDNRITVSIEGSITGYESDANSRWTNVEAYFAGIPALVFSRCQTYSGVTLNTTAISSTIGRNPIAGTISYSYSYNNRPSNYISDAKSESISIIDNNNADVFAQIVVPGRTRGPILQDINTVQAAARALNVEAVFTIPTGTVTQAIAAKPNIDSLVTEVENTLLPAFQIFKESDEETWDWINGRYTRNVRWVYERE